MIVINITFKNIKINNFLSFGNADLNLRDNGYTLISGINKNVDDLAKSNGAGKSTVFEAIVWCLTGTTIRGTTDVKNIHTNDGTLVELDFDIDNIEYKIIRSKDHSEYKTNLKIFINGEDKSGKGIRDTSKLLNEYLPDLTGDLLGSVIILGQGLPQRFTNNTPSGRKEVLEKLSKSDFMLEDLKDRISKRKSELTSLLRTSEDGLLRLESTKSLLESQINDNQIKLESLGTTEKLDELISMLEDSILDCNIKVNFYNEQVEQLRTTYQTTAEGKNDVNAQINLSYESLSKTQDKIGKLNEQLNNDKQIIENKFKPIFDNYNSKYIQANTELKTNQAELVKMKNVKDTCPTCGQKLPGVFKPNTSNIETAIESLNNSIIEITNLKKQAETDKQIELDGLHSYDTEFTILNLEIDRFKNEIAELKIKCTTIDTELNNITKQANSFKSDSEVYTNKITTYQNQINAAKLEKESLETKKQAAITIIESNTSQIKELTEQIAKEESNKEDIKSHLDIVNNMNNIISRDFRGYLLSNVIADINNKSKEFALDIFGTDKIEFVQNGNNISISYDGKEYENLSGGEKQKIDLIVQFAIRDMLCRHLNFNSNILVLDEIFDNLDDIGCQRVLNLISTKLNADSIYIVTHRPDLGIPYDHEITIVKDSNKISRIESFM